jgi:hypothetical protein
MNINFVFSVFSRPVYLFASITYSYFFIDVVLFRQINISAVDFCPRGTEMSNIWQTNTINDHCSSVCAGGDLHQIVRRTVVTAPKDHFLEKHQYPHSIHTLTFDKYERSASRSGRFTLNYCAH